MKRKTIIAAIALSLAALPGAGCLEEKVLELVFTAETSADFAQDEDNSSWTEPETVDFGDEIRKILNDNGYSDEDLAGAEAYLTSASYGVTKYEQSENWVISGSINVTYGATTETILDYTSESVPGLLGAKKSAALKQPAVDLINQALADFLAGADPILTFTIVNGSTTPAPTDQQHMIFEWRAWLAIQLILDQSVEVPDPF
jgi:hypothetical protein